MVLLDNAIVKTTYFCNGSLEIKYYSLMKTESQLQNILQVIFKLIFSYLLLLYCPGEERKADFTKNLPAQNGSKVGEEMSKQSSQVFVFTTQLANKAAVSVSSGTYNSIISYHLEEPNTKRFIQVNGRCLPAIILTSPLRVS